jgi:hypothetical protein
MPAALPSQLTALLDPAAYPHAVSMIRVVETHLSWVFLTGELAYKVKKPVSFPFVDLRSAERRGFLCAKELRLNRRFSIGGCSPRSSSTIAPAGAGTTRWRALRDAHVLASTQEIADVAAYVATLARSPDTTPGPRRWVEKGAEFYVRRCQWCHGPRGEGNDKGFVPRVAGQQYVYLLRQLHDMLEARRPNIRTQHLRLFEGRSMEELQGLEPTCRASIVLSSSSSGAARMHPRRVLQQLADLAVLGLAEILVPFSDGTQRRRDLEDYDFIALGADECGALVGGHGRRRHHRCCAGFAGGAHRGQHGGSRRQPVVDENHRLAAELKRRAPGAVELLAPFELAMLACGECGKFLSIGLKAAISERPSHGDRAGSDRPERELRLAGHADLAHQHHIEGCPQRLRHLEGYRHSAARQPEHDQRPAQPQPANDTGQLPACSAAIGEHSKRDCHAAHSLTQKGAVREYAEVSWCPAS